MKARTLRTLAAALGLATGAATAQEPAKLKQPVPTAPAAKAAKATGDLKVTGDQKVAAAVADKLANMPAAQDLADLQLSTSGGTVTVTGTCKTDAQKQAVLKAVSTTGGVTLVKDGLKVAAAKPVAPAVSTPAVLPTPMPKPTAPTIKQAQSVGPVVTPAPVGVPPAAMAGNPDVEPLPLGPAGGGMAMAAPPLPNHAWPTYAPYPNMSRVAYPSAYPYNAFPYIGPYYPFPKVPLGWRSVTLSWEDGHWWLGRKQTPQDYWRVKFGY